MNPIVTVFNKGFGNCIFMSREPKYVEATIVENAEKCFNEIPAAVKITPVDDLHDKLSLSLKDGVVEGVLLWRKSVTGAHYVLEANALQLTE